MSAVRSRSLSPIGGALCAVAFGFAACSVDDRQLEGATVTIIPSGGRVAAGGTTSGSSGQGATAGSGGAPVTGGAAGSDAGVGGAAGGSGGASAGSGATAGGTDPGTGGTDPAAGGSAGAGEPPRCPDLDDNGVLDCDESIVMNASFDKDVKSWLNDVEMELEWEDRDATGQGASGALGATSSYQDDREGGRLLGARQCVPIVGGNTYEFAAQVYVPEDAGKTYAGLEMQVWDGPSCSGNPLDKKQSETLVPAGPDWGLAALTYLTPTSGKSVNVRLLWIKPYRQDPVTVLFDNVLVHQVQ